jgi:hypothetical protein
MHACMCVYVCMYVCVCKYVILCIRAVTIHNLTFWFDFRFLPFDSFYFGSIHYAMLQDDLKMRAHVRLLAVVPVL